MLHQVLEPRIRAQWVIDEIDFQEYQPMRSMLICFLKPLGRTLLVIESDIYLRYSNQCVIVRLSGQFQFFQDFQCIVFITRYRVGICQSSHNSGALEVAQLRILQRRNRRSSDLETLTEADFADTRLRTGRCRA